MKRVVADWYLVHEAEKVGNVSSMTNVVERNRNELNKKLSLYFRSQLPDYKSIFDEDECEDILYTLNTYIEENGINKREMDFSGTDIHLLKITDNLQIKIVISDEYYGGGDYSKYIEIGKFLINEYTTEKDVDKLIEFVTKYLQ
ncbi:hypothetical protein GCM10023310_69000 [Paenibacillus vulneris]|uniref:Uncharacterized protein n=1 Tax=Paenibacillus vulneris TaxID=1133364 RepID=A0ABW3UJ88_9BACL